METDPFCKIIARELPAEIVYEDEDSIAFLDIMPNALGHTLVVPKKHAVNIFDVDEDSLAAVMSSVKKVAGAVMEATGAKGVHVNSNHGAEAGQIVFHLHFHIIPRHDRSEFSFWHTEEYKVEESKVLSEKIREGLATKSN